MHRESHRTFFLLATYYDPDHVPITYFPAYLQENMNRAPKEQGTLGLHLVLKVIRGSSQNLDPPSSMTRVFLALLVIKLISFGRI